MGRVISDAEMAQLEHQEAQSVSPGAKKVLSDSEMAQLEESHANKPGNQGAAQSALEGFGQTATLGYLPQIQAAAGSAMGLGDYTKLRDENIARQKAQSKENPWSANLGKLAGVVPQAVMGGAPASLGRTVAQGAITGAAYNPGDTEGEISPIQVKDRALGALLGAGTAGALGLAQKGLAGVKESLGGVGRGVMDMRNPSGLRDEARSAINDVSARLPKAESDNVYAALRDKNIEINPRDYMGLDPKADAILNKYRATVASPVETNSGAPIMRDVTASRPIPAKDVYDVRKALDSGNYSRAGYGAQVNQPISPKDMEIAEKAGQLRQMLRDSGGDVADAIGDLRSSVGDAQALQRSGKFDPVKFFDDPNLNRQGMMHSADGALGTNLRGLSKRVTNASSMREAPVKGSMKVLINGALDGMGGDVSPGASDALLRAFLEGKRK